MSKVILIVDPQIDFISGSLPVPNASEAMDWLSEYIGQHYNEYDHLVVTLDQHPLKHCSFQENGGFWPVHCLKYSNGAAIYPLLMDRIKAVSKHIPVTFLEKATQEDKDEYSSFEKDVPQILLDADHIDVAGLAGDVCVRQSVEDLKKHGLGDKIHKLEKGIAYIMIPEK
ncbi:isochorismatase family protein [Falsiporphyromonas endometrii]|uniref:nicotinamidase n=1 Tax=Falsiporphyromonas endometrii TaxID=1387297 RepID=A0ABV9K5F0_9PORP